MSQDQQVDLMLATPGDFINLMKPRVMSLVVFTAWVGLILAPVDMPLFLIAACVFCIAIGAGASGVLNMWYEADTDAIMSRTRNRPLPRGKMSRDAALGFGLTLALMSVIILCFAGNYFAGGFLAFTIFFYAVIYTMWLKRATPQNIVIGGAAGAFPPMIGWAAATGGVSWDSFILFAIIFLWTPPHFWALALYKRGDYEKAGIPMMPNVKGAKSTRLQIFVYALIVAAVTFAPVFTGLGGFAYLVAAIVLNAVFVYLAYKVFRSRAGERDIARDSETLYDVKKGDIAARNLFAWSILYLFGLFGVLAIEDLVPQVMRAVGL